MIEVHPFYNHLSFDSLKSHIAIICPILLILALKTVVEEPFGATENPLNLTAKMRTSVFRGTNNAAPGTMLEIWNTVDYVVENLKVFDKSYRIESYKEII